MTGYGLKLEYTPPHTMPERIPFKKNVLGTPVTSERNTLFPDLTSFRPALPVQWTEITAFSEDYQRPAAPEKLQRSHGVSPIRVSHTGLTIGKQSTSFLRAGITSQKDAV